MPLPKERTSLKGKIHLADKNRQKYTTTIAQAIVSDGPIAQSVRAGDS